MADEAGRSMDRMAGCAAAAAELPEKAVDALKEVEKARAARIRKAATSAERANAMAVNSVAISPPATKNVGSSRSTGEE